MERISIITPSYNQGQYIEETILSVINQGYPNIEYIIIDGGSTDNTVEIIKKYESKITYWISEKDTGQTNAINKGLALATGSIINWLNSDDLLLPGALFTMAQHFEKNPQAIMIHGRIRYFGNGASYCSKNLSPGDLDTRYVSHICMPQPACFFRRRLIDEQGYLDETLHFSMDTDLYVRAGLHYEMVQVEDVIAKFRLHHNSKSVSSFNLNFLEDNKVIFSRTLVGLKAMDAVETLKKLQLFVNPAYLYLPGEKEFDCDSMLFYFLEHRLYTLHEHRNRREYLRLYYFLMTHFFSRLVLHAKLHLYACSLLLPYRIIMPLKRYIRQASN